MITLDDVQKEVERQIKRDLAGKTELELKSIMMSGLAEETGEVNGLFKRELRKLPKDLARCTKEHYVEELGDVLWYLVGVLYSQGLTLDEIWQYNIQKLEERYGN